MLTIIPSLPLTLARAIHGIYYCLLIPLAVRLINLPCDTPARPKRACVKGVPTERKDVAALSPSARNRSPSTQNGGNAQPHPVEPHTLPVTCSTPRRPSFGLMSGWRGLLHLMNRRCCFIQAFRASQYLGRRLCQCGSIVPGIFSMQPVTLFLRLWQYRVQQHPVVAR